VMQMRIPRMQLALFCLVAFLATFSPAALAASGAAHGRATQKIFKRAKRGKALDVAIDDAGQTILANIGATGTPSVLAQSSDGYSVLSITRASGMTDCLALAKGTPPNSLSVAVAACPSVAQRVLDLSGFATHYSPTGPAVTDILRLTGFTDGTVSRIGVVADGVPTLWFPVTNRVYDVSFPGTTPATDLIALNASGDTVWSEHVG
jgi:hypothetical protein